MVTIIAGCSSASIPSKASPVTRGIVFNEIKVTIFQLPDCECCKEYTTYLKERGFPVETIYLTNETYQNEAVSSLLARKGQIPRTMLSCHTAVIKDYLIEGHVPVAAIEKLLAEKPDIDGITLPGMPAGSPGMPGQPTKAFIIYALSDGTASEFMIIDYR